MGGFYGSIHVRTTDEAAVKAAAEAIASERKAKFLVAPEIGGWVTLFPDNNGQDSGISEALAPRLSGVDLIHCLVHDDDVFAYWLFRGGHLADRYNSRPDYFGGENAEPRGGNAQVFAHLLINDAGVGDLQALLDGDRFTFEHVRLGRFAKILGLPNAVSAYEYLQEGERAGIKQWRKFVHIPDLSAAKSVKRAAAARARSELKGFKAAGVVLVDEVGDKAGTKHPVWAIDPDTSKVLCGWVAHFGASAIEWQAFGPGDWKAEPAQLSSGGRVQLVRFSPSGKWLALGCAYGDWRVEIWNWPERKSVEHKFPDHVDAIAFNADETAVFVASKGSIHTVPLTGSATIASAAPNMRRCQTIAVHPGGQWLAFDYDGMLALFDLASPASTLLHGIGGLLDYGAVFAQTWENPEVKKHLSPEQIEHYRKEQLQHRYRAKEPVVGLQFSADGKWLLCATQSGVRVFDWIKLLSCGTGAPQPDLTADGELVAPQEEAEPVLCTLSMAYDALRNRILFGGLEGKVKYLDMTAGRSGDLLTDLEGIPVLRLELTPDRTALVMTRNPLTRDNRRRPWRFQVWNYQALCERAGLEA